MPKPNRGVGRPRNSDIDLAIVCTTRELLAERGYAGLTVDAVAARAGIGKAAIYRRYKTKQEMIFAATVHDLWEQPPPDGGTLRADLLALTRTIAAQLCGAPADVLAGLLADIYADKALGTRFAETFLESERKAVTAVLERAVTRGELASRPEASTVHALLLGPILAWVLILDGDRGEMPEFTRTVAEATAATLLLRPTS
ncbi:TetR/AcrR family transcriptional regulator [Nocardia sp. SC052]|uniref:TetR/AcrR family transcriptional regulator n=1 Tax=Nocardia sichangensis TaxID=3385975 RepID=UPI0039A2C1F2